VSKASPKLWVRYPAFIDEDVKLGSIVWANLMAFQNFVDFIFQWMVCAHLFVPFRYNISLFLVEKISLDKTNPRKAFAFLGFDCAGCSDYTWYSVRNTGIFVAIAS
jgi:hypothetical protein